MIEVLKPKNAAWWHLTDVQLSTATLPAEELGSLSDNSFTHSYTNLGFQSFEDPTIATQHMRRTLAPDVNCVCHRAGRFVVHGRNRECVKRDSTRGTTPYPAVPA